MFEQLLPYGISGLVAGLVAWGTIRAEIRWMRRDIDSLRDRVHGPNNPNSLVNKLQIIETRVTTLEVKEGMERQRP